MKSPIARVVGELVPLIYDDTITTQRLHPYTDMSASNKCHTMTRDLQMSLASRGIQSRRELHQTSDGLWHYVIAHTLEESNPTGSDTITDLNPWQFTGPHHETGYLHARRDDILDILEKAGAPEWFISLRALSTIAKAHTMGLTPFVRL